MHLVFAVEEKAGKRSVSVELRGAVICGYTARDQDAVRKHIAELEKQGIAPPPSIPMFYPKPDWSLCFEGEIHVQGAETSGEVEFVLLIDRGITYVGVGSDHTDRELEKHSVVKSKQVCPSVLSRTLWDYDEIKDHWDQIEFRSWAIRAGEKVLYQQCTLASILRPNDLLSQVRAHVSRDLEGIAIFSGTSALLTDGFVFADRFGAELSDPVLGRKIRVEYGIHTLEWFAA
jgi:hypothetical protein